MDKRFLQYIKAFLAPPSRSNSFWQKKRLGKFVEFHGNGPLLNVGSKNRGLGENVIYLDIQPSRFVDIVGDIHDLPIKSEVIKGIIATAILEHVHSPDRAVEECHRVLRAGGGIYASIPFMYGYHADPTDFQRYTHKGIKHLFSEFQLVEVVKTRGIGSTLVGILTEFFSILFCVNSKIVYRGLRYLFGWIFFPLKYLDFLTVQNRLEYIIASGFTVIARKEE